MTPTVDELISTLDGISATQFESQDDRVRVFKAVQRLNDRLETPFEAINRLIWQNPPYEFALKTGIDIGLWPQLTDIPKSTTDLATATSTDPDFLRRILRHLGSRRTIVEHGEDLWSASEFSRALCEQDVQACIRWGTPYMTKIFDAGPEYFKEFGYKIPPDGAHTLYQKAFNVPDTPAFVNLMKSPEDARGFNLMLSWYARTHPTWIDMGAIEEWFEKPGLGLEDPNAVAVVDIAGGLGLDLAWYRKRFPKSKLPARAVLQELPEVIEEAKTKGHGMEGMSIDEVELQVYDFFTEQPIKGARVYYMASIIHDWPNHDAKKILGHIAAAMKKGYSKLLISDYVIPPTECRSQISGLDLVMMTFLGSQERPRATWDELFESSGLKVVKIHDTPTAYKSVIEVELA